MNDSCIQRGQTFHAEDSDNGYLVAQRQRILHEQNRGIQAWLKV